ncbi:MAG: phosphate ABC transporter permease subunit PstC [Deferribacterota bacterium]|nr:phosphate ABC transporter permease subunit PstC [Deferribacterota bacterium]
MKGFKRDIYQKFADNLFRSITFLASTIILIIIISIFISLIIDAYPAIKEFGFFGFIFSTAWDPIKEVFGAATTIYGTLITTLLSLLFAIPVSIGIAIFITELCPNFLKPTFSTTIELLAAIPSIIYGMWGLFTLAPIMGEYIEPFLQNITKNIPIINKLFEGPTRGIDIFTSGVILSIMITPFITSIVRDTFELTPRQLKESAYGIGATKWEVIKDVVIPYCRLGIYGSIIIAMGRALGETMAVAFVLGNKHEIATSLFDASATITVTLANEFTEADSELYLSSLFYLALILFTMNFVMLAIAKFLLISRMKK